MAANNTKLTYPIISCFILDILFQVNELATAAQLVQHDKGAPATAQRAANLLLQAEQEANAAIQEVQAEIALHDEKGEVLKKEAAAVRAARRKSAEPDPFDKGKGKARVVDDSSSDESDDDSDSMSGEGMPKTPAGREHVHKKTGLVNRLRDWYLTLHRVKFLQGDVYHVMGDHKALDEEAAYAAAEVLRKQLLKCKLLRFHTCLVSYSRRALTEYFYLRSDGGICRAGHGAAQGGCHNILEPTGREFGEDPRCFR